MTIEEVKAFYRFLQGTVPDFIHVSPLNLTPEQAFTVMWYLQEIPRIIPDNYEACCECGDLFDTEHQGYCLDEDAMLAYIQDARWPTHEWYCDNSCLGVEIDRQEEVLFRRFCGVAG